MNTATEIRSIAAIAADMDRIAKRRDDVNRLRGAKLLAYKRLELELEGAKLARADANAKPMYEKGCELLAAEIAGLEGRA